MRNDITVLEEHYSVKQLAEQWKFHRSTIARIFKDEPGVMRLAMGQAGREVTLRIPASVAARVYNRITNSGSGS